MKILSINNEKGGVGKTTLCFNAATWFRYNMGLRVLAIDLDTQASLTDCLGIERVGDSFAGMTGYTLFDESPNLDVTQTKFGVDLIPGDARMAVIDGKASKMGFDAVIRNARRNLERVASNYDVCLIDNKPSIDRMQASSLAIADYVISPVRPSQADLNGLKNFWETISFIYKNHHPGLHLIGAVINDIDYHFSDDKRIAEVIRDRYAGAIIEPELRRRSAYRSASRKGVPIWSTELSGSSVRNARIEMTRVLKHVADVMKLKPKEEAA